MPYLFNAFAYGINVLELLDALFSVISPTMKKALPTIHTLKQTESRDSVYL